MQTMTQESWLLALIGMSGLWAAATVIALALCRAAAAADRAILVSLGAQQHQGMGLPRGRHAKVSARPEGCRDLRDSQAI
jgi:hypothetical protein